MPVGSQELISLLRRFITYMQFKFISGFRYQEIPLTFLKRIITRVETVPEVTKVTRVIEGQPSLTKVTRVIEGEPSITKVTRVIEGEPSITKVTRVIEGEPSITKVTRVIEGEPTLTKVTRVVSGGPQSSYSAGTTNVELEDLSTLEGTMDADRLAKSVQAGRQRVRN
ncbi:unnamed protein product [Knipowitschia caucasica]